MDLRHRSTDEPSLQSKPSPRQRETGIRTKMLVKIAAKMLIIAWTLMKRKEPFNPAYIQA
jgi:uncharacterized membrane protein YhiD involved in acid resistance